MDFVQVNEKNCSVEGLTYEGLRITQFPVARAGAIFPIAEAPSVNINSNIAGLHICTKHQWNCR
jgi:hypothetical protein